MVVSGGAGMGVLGLGNTSLSVTKVTAALLGQRKNILLVTKTMLRSRTWCFTWNNFGVEAHSILLNSKFEYLIYQVESGSNGTQHLQGYVEFRSPVRLKALRSLSSDIHWEVRKGTRLQAIEYCSKQKTRNGMHVEIHY